MGKEEEKDAKARNALEKLTSFQRENYSTLVINLFNKYRVYRNIGNIFHPAAEESSKKYDKGGKFYLIDKDLLFTRLRGMLTISDEEFVDYVLETVDELKQASANHMGRQAEVTSYNPWEFSYSQYERERIKEYSQKTKQDDLVCLHQEFIDKISSGIRCKTQKLPVRLSSTIDEKIATDEVIVDSKDSTYLTNLLKEGNIEEFNKERARTNHLVMYLNGNKLSEGKFGTENNPICGADLSYVILDEIWAPNMYFKDCDFSEAQILRTIHVSGNTNLLYSKVSQNRLVVIFNEGEGSRY